MKDDSVLVLDIFTGTSLFPKCIRYWQYIYLDIPCMASGEISERHRPHCYIFTRATLASAGISCRRVSVCPSVCVSVCHMSVFYIS